MFHLIRVLCPCGSVSYSQVCGTWNMKTLKSSMVVSFIHFLTHIVLGYRNYVVQYILDLKTAWSSTEVMVRLEGNYAFLSTQKFSSNVVEKCLKLGVEEPRARLVRELMTSPHLGQLLQDQYANYVIQSALSVCKVSTPAVWKTFSHI